MAAAAAAAATAENTPIGTKRKCDDPAPTSPTAKRVRSSFEADPNGMTFGLCWLRNEQHPFESPVLRVGYKNPVYVPLVVSTDPALGTTGALVDSEKLARGADGVIIERKKTYAPVAWSTFKPGDAVHYTVAFGRDGDCFVTLNTPTGVINVRLTKYGCTKRPMVFGDVSKSNGVASVLHSVCEVPWRPEGTDQRITVEGEESKVEVVVPPINVHSVKALSGYATHTLAARHGNEPATPPVDGASFALLESEAEASFAREFGV